MTIAALRKIYRSVWRSAAVASALLTGSVTAGVTGTETPAASVRAAASMPVNGADETAHPFGVDDLLALEDVGRAWSPPESRLVVFDAMRPFRELSTDTAMALRGQARTHLLVAPVDGSRPVYELFAQDFATGYSLGTPSPDRRRSTILMVKDGALSSGIYDFDSGKFTPLGLTTAFELGHFLSVWLSNTEVLLESPPAGRQSPTATAETGWAREMMRAWPQAWSGRGPVVSELRSGTPYAEHPAIMGGTLICIDVVSGQRREVGEGHFYNVVVSADGRRVAAVRDRGPVLPIANEPLSGYEPLRNTELVVYTLKDRNPTPRYPCRNCSVISSAVAWSPQGKLLFFAKTRDDDPWARGQYFEYDPRTDRTVPVLSARSGLVSPLEDGRQTAGGMFLSLPEPRWFDGGWLLLARRAPLADGRVDWYWIPSGQRAPVNLTAQFTQAPSAILATTGHESLVLGDGALWALRPSGRRTRVSSPSAPPLQPVDAERESGTLLFTQTVNGTSELIALDTHTRRVLPTDIRLKEEDIAVQTVLSAPTSEGYALVKRYSNDGCSLLAVRRDGKTNALYAFNKHFQIVLKPTPVRFEYRSLDGKPRAAWLLIPPGHTAGERLPVVTYVYLRQSAPLQFKDKIDQLWLRTGQSMHLMAGHGFAVLFPEIEGPLFNHKQDVVLRLPQDVLPAIDRAAELGLIDAERVAVYGTSYGSMATAALLMQTNRFKAAVTEANGQFDFISTFGLISRFDRDQPDVMSTYAEAFFRAPPWKDPESYIRNSALLHADRITTPWMLIQGGLDYLGPTPPQEAEAMFAALYRQRKDAILLRYWGQGHGFVGEADTRDKWTRIYAWLDRYLLNAR